MADAPANPTPDAELMYQRRVCAEPILSAAANPVTDKLRDAYEVVANPTPEDRIERCERAIAEMQSALHDAGIYTPSRELDLIDLP